MTRGRARARVRRARAVRGHGGACVEWLVDEASRADWREAFPGFARMDADGTFFDYAAEDAFLARVVTGGRMRR